MLSTGPFTLYIVAFHYFKDFFCRLCRRLTSYRYLLTSMCVLSRADLHSSAVSRTFYRGALRASRLFTYTIFVSRAVGYGSIQPRGGHSLPDNAIGNDRACHAVGGCICIEKQDLDLRFRCYPSDIRRWHCAVEKLATHTLAFAYGIE